MKRILFVILTFIVINISYGQYINDTRIDSIVNLVSQQQITKYMRELTGDTVTMVGGIQRLIFSRYYSSPANAWAAQYIFEKFQGFGLSPYYMVVDSLCKNVIAVKTGTKYPNQKIIICAHYDNKITPTLPEPLDTVHGANDNASGVCGVLEAARLLSNMNFEYTIVFAAWDEEEVGPDYYHGSRPYADTAFAHGDSIKAVINMDMISYDIHNKIEVLTDSNSYIHAELFSVLCNKYIPSITPEIYVGEFWTDISPFYDRGFQGISPFIYSYDPYYHTINDKISNMNLPYCTKIIKAVIADLMTYALNKRVIFLHTPLTSSYDTSSKIATIIIKIPNKIPVTSNAPRLYYSVNNNPYTNIVAFYRNIDTFKFVIPGNPQNTSVKYYFAVQDSLGNYSATYPPGGSGINPPGTSPPPNQFRYDIYFDYNQCSNTVPKPINDNQITIDTISTNSIGYIKKVKINLTLNHQNDGDIIIQLLRPGYNLNLSVRNGQGGQNYINTVFDDSSAISITQGTPPFTGSFKPQGSPLSLFNDQLVSGKWMLKITDAASGNQGTLINWCLLFQTKNSVNVNEEIVPIEYDISQNYPNPFNSSTIISYTIPKATYVELRIFDLLGKEVRTLVNEYQNAGKYLSVFNSGNLPSGIYFYRFTTNDYSSIKKLVLIK